MKNEKIFDEQNMRKIIRILSGLKSQADELANKCVLPYDDAKVYSKDDICFYNGTLYRAKTVTLGNTPDPESTYFEMLDGVEEEIDAQYIETLMSTVSAETFDYMKNFINDDIISGTHGYSSSKIYTEIQNAIQTAKDYTLEQIANSSTGSYVIANGTDEVVDDKHLFLISNGSNYDIYALVNGAPTKIGDTSVSLDGLLTEANAESTYLKQSDATATYATITTTDGLRTDLNNHTNDTIAHLTQEERDKLVTTDDIITTLDNTATDEQLASALATYKALDDKNIYHFSSPTEGDANTLVIKGKSVHYQISNAVITSGTIANLPPNIGVGGLLISHGLATVHQFFLTHNNRVYKRYGYWANTTDTEPTWVGTWERVISEGDLNRTVNGNGDIRIEIPANADMNNYTTAGFYKVLSGSNAITIANLPINNACLINIYGNSNSATGWMVQEIIADNSIINNRYIRYKIQNNAEWSPWEKLCTTKVADTSGTATVSNDATGTVSYKVINGICYVSVHDIADGLNGLGICSITGLPAPNMYVNVGIELNGTRVGSIYCDSGATTFGVHKSTTTKGCGSFSYPVKES